jgi:manganese/zinc/iron transport system permease protein
MIAPADFTTFTAPLAVLGFEWDYTLRNVVFGSAILGAVGGVFGCFATLRRQSLLGDALAHAALPGVCLAFILTGAKSSLALMTGAALSGLIGTLLLLLIVRQSRIKEDAALGIVLSVGFGFGIFLLTRIQASGNAAQSGLDRFLFGQAATLVARDVRTMAVLGAVALAAVWLLFKEFKLLTFDPDFAAALGYPTTRLTIGLTALIVVAVVIGLQTVGVILIVALLIAPAAAARQWTDRLSLMLALAAGFGVLSGVVGSVLSARIERLPTGPTIVLIATAIAAASVLLAPNRGVLWAGVRRWRQRGQLQAAAALRALADLSRSAAGAPPAVPVADLAASQGQSLSTVASAMRRLVARGLAEPVAASTGVPGPAWRLTAAGLAAAATGRHQEDLWRAALGRQLDLPADAVHLNATDLERLLPPDILAGLTPEAAAPQASAPAAPRPPLPGRTLDRSGTGIIPPPTPETPR